MNFPLWKSEQVEEKSLEYLRNFIPISPDQDALNAGTDGKSLFMPFKWNFVLSQGATFDELICIDEEGRPNCAHSRKDINEAITNPKIIHFVRKPWKANKHIITNNYKVILYPHHDTWWDMVEKVPFYSSELLAIKNSSDYQDAVQKDFEFANSLSSDKFSFKVWYYKMRPKIREIERKIEKPFKALRQVYRSKKVAKKIK